MGSDLILIMSIVVGFSLLHLCHHFVSGVFIDDDSVGDKMKEKARDVRFGLTIGFVFGVFIVYLSEGL